MKHVYELGHFFRDSMMKALGFMKPSLMVAPGGHNVLNNCEQRKCLSQFRGPHGYRNCCLTRVVINCSVSFVSFPAVPQLYALHPDSTTVNKQLFESRLVIGCCDLFFQNYLSSGLIIPDLVHVVKV